MCRCAFLPSRLPPAARVYAAAAGTVSRLLSDAVVVCLAGIERSSFCYSHRGARSGFWGVQDYATTSMCSNRCHEETLPRVLGVERSCENETVSLFVQMADYGPAKTEAKCAFWILNEAGTDWVFSGQQSMATIDSPRRVTCAAPEDLTERVRVTLQVYSTDAPQTNRHRWEQCRPWAALLAPAPPSRSSPIVSPCLFSPSRPPPPTSTSPPPPLDEMVLQRALLLPSRATQLPLERIRLRRILCVLDGMPS